MLLTCLLALTLTTPDLTPAEFDRVLKGEVLARSEASESASGKTSGRGVGAIAVDRPVEQTWRILANYQDKAEYQPRVDKCTIVARDGYVLHVAMDVNATLMTVHYTGIYTLDPVAHAVHWVLDKQAAGNTIRDMEGGYVLIPVSPSRTIIYLNTYVDSGALVPRFIQNFFSVKAIPDLLKAVKMRVESDGAWHK